MYSLRRRIDQLVEGVYTRAVCWSRQLRAPLDANNGAVGARVSANVQPETVEIIDPVRADFTGDCSGQRRAWTRYFNPCLKGSTHSLVLFSFRWFDQR